MIDQFATSVTASIPVEHKYGIDPVMIYNIFVLACKGIVACSKLPLAEAKRTLQASFDGKQFSDATGVPTAHQIRIAARQNNTFLAPFQARQWAHYLLLTAMNTPDATLTTVLGTTE